MGRPSKLNSVQEKEILKRLAGDESNRSVAKAFKVSEMTIRRIFSSQVPQVQDVAQRLATAERDLERLPVSSQSVARSIADRLKTTGETYAEVAERGIQTANKISKWADETADAARAAKDPAGLQTVKGMAGLVNDLSAPAAALLRDNRPKDPQGDQQATLGDLLGTPRKVG